MNNEDYMNLVESVSKQVMDKIDFQRGIVQERSDEMREKGCALDVRWKMNVRLILYIHRWHGSCWYCVERNGEQVSPTHFGRKYDDQFFHLLQHLVNEVDNGDFNYKKTISEKIAEIVHERQLTSYMNDTKWKEFIHAMDEEMSIEVPYDYKTLLNERDNLSFCTGYDIESFNGYHFLNLMSKYSIPYEYDEANEAYTIYGYKR